MSGVAGALELAGCEASSNALRSDRRFSRLRSACREGLPADAIAEYDNPPFPLHVARLSVGADWTRWRTGIVTGRAGSASSSSAGRTGDGGAYISASWLRAAGDVRADNSCRTLSH